MTNLHRSASERARSDPELDAIPASLTRWVAVIGGTGYFGRLLVEDLLRHTDLGIVVTSRRRDRAQALVTALSSDNPVGPSGHSARERLRAGTADLDDPAGLPGALEGAFAAVCAAGPFHRMPTSLLETCLARGIHYLDLADDRGFVRRARAMAERARHRGAVQRVAVCAGRSTAPALNGVLVRIAAERLDEVSEIRAQIAPGNRAPRSEATVASVLRSAGRPFRLWQGAAWRDVTGWSRPRVFRYPPPVGERVGYLVDVPDHEIFPDLFGARSVAFRAGSELPLLDAGMSLLAGLTRLGLLDDWSRAARPLRAAMAATASLGHDAGAVGVEVEGTRGGRRTLVRVCVTAPHDGRRIPVMPASITLARLAAGMSVADLATNDRWIDGPSLYRECVRRGFTLTVEST